MEILQALEFATPAFLYSLAAIVLIDLVLAGDNAIVIALAARNLPPELRKRAIVWGALGAVVVRSAMTLAVVWLLKIPGLLVAGGLLLLWIAYKLLTDSDSADEGHVAGAATFAGAMKTIIVADAVMGIDNVLAVAGAAHGSYVLVVLGLLISIPIVIWGSTLILKFTERHPWIVYVGAGVLAWTGVRMALAEPRVAEVLEGHVALVVALYVIAIGGTILAGWLVNRQRIVQAAVRAYAVNRREARRNGGISTRTGRVEPRTADGGAVMERILVPVDGSPNAIAAVNQAVADAFRSNGEARIVLLNVQPPFSRHIARHSSAESRAQHHEERAARALAPARELLQRRGVPFEAHYVLGTKAEAIADFARDHGVTRIVLGTARKNSLTRFIESSVTARLLERATVPVQVVVGTTASPWERYGVPAGAAAVLAAVLLAD